MSTKIEINLDGLSAEVLKREFPLPSSLAAGMAASFETFTSKKNEHQPFSGYRRQVLANEGFDESVKLASKLRARFENLLVLGIGGSALGAKCMLQAFAHKTDRTVEILDNLDPLALQSVFKKIDLKKTAIAVISKSGGTLETMAQAAWILKKLQASGLNPKDHIVAVTDAQTGALRAWCKKEGFDALALPSDVGGRFSVFSPVGILPLAFAGVDVKNFLEGAQSAFSQRVYKMEQVFGLASRLAQLEVDGYMKAHVFMPYASVLKDMGAWFVQLWGESLGKHATARRRTGLAPIAAVGATDQHSLLQYLVDAPNHCVTAFVNIAKWPGESMKFEATLPEEFSSLSFAVGKDFGQILNAQSQATQKVLMNGQRPTYSLTLSQLDEAHIAALMAFCMDLTTATGIALSVNPYDQPGVELGKKITAQILNPN